MKVFNTYVEAVRYARENEITSFEITLRLINEEFKIILQENNK